MNPMDLSTAYQNIGQQPMMMPPQAVAPQGGTPDYNMAWQPGQGPDGNTVPATPQPQAAPQPAAPLSLYDINAGGILRQPVQSPIAAAAQNGAGQNQNALDPATDQKMPPVTGRMDNTQSPTIGTTDDGKGKTKTFYDKYGTAHTMEFAPDGKGDYDPTGKGTFDGEKYESPEQLKALEAKYLSKQGERETGVKGAPSYASVLNRLPAFPDDPTGAKRAMYAFQMQQDFAKEANARSLAELGHKTAIHGKILDQIGFNAQRAVEATGDESKRQKVIDSQMKAWSDIYPGLFKGEGGGTASPITKAAANLSPDQKKAAEIQEANLDNTKTAIKAMFSQKADANGQPVTTASTPENARILVDLIRNAGDSKNQKAAAEHAMQYIANNPDMQDAITKAAAGDYLKTNQQNLAPGSLNLKKNVLDTGMPFQLMQSGFGGSALNRFVGDTIGSDVVGKPLVAVLPNGRNVLIPYSEKHRQYFSGANPAEKQAIEGRNPVYSNLLQMFQQLNSGK